MGKKVKVTVYGDHCYIFDNFESAGKILDALNNATATGDRVACMIDVVSDEQPADEQEV